MLTRTQVIAMLLAVAAFAPCSFASSTTIPIDVQATYLITNQDPNAKPATPISLSSLGVKEGDKIQLQSVGTLSFCITSDCPQIQTSLRALFSATADPSTALPTADGTHFPEPPTLFGNIPTDVGFVLNDFFVFASPDATNVTVPKGANFLFVIVPDSFYSDNVGAISVVVTFGCTAAVSDTFVQSDPLWAGIKYDSTNKTIGQKGCAISSLAMAMRYAGVTNIGGANLDPAVLNSFLTVKKDYANGGNVAWNKSVRDVASLSNVKLRFNTLSGWISSAQDRTGAANELDEALCARANGISKPTPVIVAVPSPTNAEGLHFVLVTGKQGADYTIIDPGFQRTLLSAYPSYETRGIVSDPVDMSGLEMSVDDPAEILLTAPSGARIGAEIGSGRVLQELPDSAYFVDNIEDDNTGDLGPLTHLIEAYRPMDGEFQIKVVGRMPAIFTLRLDSFDQQGLQKPRLDVLGVTDTGRVAGFKMIYSSATNTAPSIQRLVTFESVLADVDDLLKINKISIDLSRDLIEKIKKAQAANEAGNKDKAAGNLSEAVDKVGGKGKEMSSELMGLLLEELGLLKNSICADGCRE